MACYSTVCGYINVVMPKYTKHKDSYWSHIYCLVLSDYRRVLDWQLDLLDHN
jgi:hypothetical protein